LIGATIVYASRIGKENADTITVTMALIVGAAQGLAIFPGLSRSGITISTALLLGLKFTRFDQSFHVFSIDVLAIWRTFYYAQGFLDDAVETDYLHRKKGAVESFGFFVNVFNVVTHFMAYCIKNI